MVLLSNKKGIESENLEDVEAKTCLYTVTEDENFVMDLFPSNKRIAIFTGCSGHAFKVKIIF
jgi:sarcosine oxidase